MTNYEKIIASLTPERLAEEIEGRDGCIECPLSDVDKKRYCDPLNCHNSILNWLNKEAE